MTVLDVDSVIARLSGAPGREDGLTHLEVLPAREARHAEWPTWLAPSVRDAFVAAGVPRPWTHQREAADLAHAGGHVVVSTGTASGKSLAYLLPALHDVETSRGPKGQRGAGVLYLSPTKALAQDQLAGVRRLGLEHLRVGTHDGDSTPEQREWTRDHAEYVLTNPDMLHRSLLPGHTRWSRFFASLRYVVVDECHHYRGVFGAHVAQVLRRLRRVAALHGAHPTFVLASATVADPEVSAGRLTGLDVVAVTDDGSPRGRTAVALWEPPFVPGVGENGAPTRRSAASEVADLMTDLVVDRVRTLAFVRSRRGVETVAAACRRMLAEVDPSLVDQVAAYRGGYLPEERRALEQALREGRLTGLAATNALELGIDISGLDAVLLAGFPGTRAAWWQQVGRAGRSATDALGVLVARDDPLDTYLVHHPEALLGAPVEANVFDPDNPYVLGPHLCAAAAESPLRLVDLPMFGPAARAAVDALTAGGLLRRRPHGWFWTDRRRASDLADIRSTGGPPVRLVEDVTGRVLGTVDHSASHGTAHPGAVYVHQGETWLVRELDLDESVAVVVRDDPDYSTSAREVVDIEILAEREATAWGRARLSLGQVRVTHQVVSFLKRRIPSGDVIAEEPLDLPEQTLETAAVWWTLPPAVLEDSGLAATDLPGAAHAAEHASIGLLPLFATCDRWDIGGVSTALHADTGMLTVFVHDGHPGGAGFAERGYAAAAAWLQATRDAIASCGCAEGCPSCVQSPKCGNQNNPLDKAGAVVLLDLLLAGAPRD
ncbi:DEAD/DEAH box helicase domain-containing protein [Nocardioides scoriae]|uniref:DEAD/DEAH box helicase domain-containing protein n=1 Tax=Nocardioides scoriae TaxID=642780 RepID=A0A1H1UD85_9ACTN|nr:DEAD/DEAH box helicase [Nocardioides scoriae]SDS70176.1 DEAD/DEAH box helicase domain-containing protein [Nocardioides scoriae]